MKFNSSQAIQILKNPFDYKGILLYGNNSGMISFYSSEILKFAEKKGISIVRKSLQDIEDNEEKFYTEVFCESLFGEKKLFFINIKQSNSNKKILEIVKSCCESNYALITTETLKANLPLRKHFEQEQNKASVSIYKNEYTNLEAQITYMLPDTKLDSKCMQLLNDIFNKDSSSMKTEIDKLVSYSNNEITVEIIKECILSQESFNMNDLAYAILDKKSYATTIIDEMIKNGFSIISIIRLTLNYITLLLKGVIMLQNGKSIKTITTELNIFFRDNQRFSGYIKSINIKKLLYIIDIFLKLESLYKTERTGSESVKYIVLHMIHTKK